MSCGQARPTRFARLLFLATLGGAGCWPSGHSPPLGSDALDAVLHVGPHKTGSTTLEAATLIQPAVRALLEKRDGIALAREMPGSYFGAKVHANLAAALLSTDMDSHPSWRWYCQYARSAYAQKLRLFITTENLSVVPNVANLRRLVSMLSEIGFRVRVVIIHRRLFEKLPSVHSELYMGTIVKRVDEYLPFVDWVAQQDAHVSSRFLQTVRLRALFDQVGAAETSILDLHRLPASGADGSLISEFICEYLRANATCNWLQGGGLQHVLSKNVRPRGLSLLYDLVRSLRRTQHAAASKAFYHTSLPRHPTSLLLRIAHCPCCGQIYGAARAQGVAHINRDRALEVLVQTNSASQHEFKLKLRCLNSTQAAFIWRSTLAEEQALVQGAARLGKVEQRELREHFKARAQQLLCSADVNAALQNSRWAVPLRKALKAAVENHAAQL